MRGAVYHKILKYDGTLPLPRKEADLCIAGLSVSMERKSTIDFATGAFIGEISLVVPKITYIPIDIWVFINVFLPLLWIGISLMIVGLMSGFLGVHMVLGEKLHLEVPTTPVL